MLETKNVLEVCNLSKSYPGTKSPAVSEISFTLQAGEILTMLGPNGAGKTTTIKMILGLISPTAGAIQLLAHDMTSPAGIRAGTQHVGAVLEGTRNSYWRLSVLENLRYFGGLRGLPRRQIDGRAGYLLELLGLESQRNQEVRRLSRGMQQKVALALALIHEPQVLILDEPTLGLDLQTAMVLEETIADLARQGKAILLTTHTMGLAERLSHRIFVINQGQRVAYDETPRLLKQFDSRTVIEIKIGEALQPEMRRCIMDRFPSLLVSANNGAAVLEWVEPEQRQVIDLLDTLDRGGNTVVSVTRREPSLEEVFLSLTNGKQHT
jgi:ABC-2 type transport system ATP-binding protein